MARNNRPPHPGAARASVGKTDPFALHKHSRAGTKLLRRFCKAKFGKRVTAEEARAWYGALTK